MSSVQPPIAQEGEVVSNYQLTSVLGKGAVGIVFRGTPSRGGAEVAVKIMPPITSSSGEMVRMTLRAATILHSFTHPNICTVQESGYLNDGRSFVVMELLHGVALKDILKKEKTLSDERAIEITKQVLQGLSAVHKHSIVHRDIKPANIYLVKNKQGQETAKIIDFGIAHVSGSREADNEGQRRGSIYGTATYISPEQIRTTNVDQRADLYAVGVMLYRMVTGQVPFRDESPQALYKAHLSQAPQKPREISSKVSPFLEAAILKAMNKKPEQRFQNAEEFIQALNACLQATETKSQTAEEPPPESPKNQAAQSSFPFAAVGLVSGLLGGFVFTYIMVSGNTATPAKNRVQLTIQTDTPADILRQGSPIGKTTSAIEAKPGEWLLLRAANKRPIAFQVGNEGKLSYTFAAEEAAPAPEIEPDTEPASEPTSNPTSNPAPTTQPAEKQ